MSRNEDVVRAVLEAVNRRDADGDQAYLADDLVYRTPAVGETDKQGWRAFHAGAYAAFPDFEVTTDRMLTAGETVIAEGRVAGTQRGEFAGMPASNRTFDVPIAFVVDVADGKVRRWHSYFDAATMLRQLGALPAPDATQAASTPA